MDSSGSTPIDFLPWRLQAPVLMNLHRWQEGNLKIAALQAPGSISNDVLLIVKWIFKGNCPGGPWLHFHKVLFCKFLKRWTYSPQG